MFYRKYRKIILPALFLPLFLIVWELYIRLFHVPNYLLPGPAELADSMVKLFVSGDIMKHIRVTMEEILMGTVIGIVIGLIGAAIPLGVLYFMYQKIIVYIAAKFNFIGSMIVFEPVKVVFRTLIPVGVILGAGIGFIGSQMTIRKHLKV